jgi:hypothetical protein
LSRRCGRTSSAVTVVQFSYIPRTTLAVRFFNLREHELNEFNEKAPPVQTGGVWLPPTAALRFGAQRQHLGRLGLLGVKILIEFD